MVVDFDTCLNFRAGHIAGAWFAIRSRLADGAENLPQGAALCRDLAGRVSWRSLPRRTSPRATGVTVKVLQGGTAAWSAAGLPMAQGEDNMADEPVDVFHRPYDRNRSVEQAMRDYLSWEVDLVRQIERDGDARFRAFPK